MKRLLALLLSALLLTGCSTAPDSSQSGPDLSAGSGSESEEVVVPEPEPEPTVSHLMVAGDAMSHMPLTKDAYISSIGDYDYSHMLADPQAQLEHSDYALANLETVLGGGPTYCGYPTFNSPDGLAYSLKAAGFDMLSTANNHSKDQGVDGIYRTLDVLDQAGLDHVGTYRSQAEFDENCGVHVADVGGISVAFLAYTYGLNGFRLSDDTMHAVNLFNLDYYTTLENPDYDRLERDMAYARSLDTDLIAVVMHWGIEYQNAGNSHQINMADFLIQQGADLVLGGHPHVLQPYETITTTGWDGQERQGFVCYSLGNFLSNQPDLETRTTAILDLELTRDNVTDETTLTDVRYTPYYMLHRDGAPLGQQRFLVNIHTAMADYEAGTSTLVDAQAYGQLQAALDHAHAILGAEGDR